MSVYGVVEPSKQRRKILYIPLNGELKDGTKVKLVNYDIKHEYSVYKIMKGIIAEGRTYPIEKMETLDSFRAYFCTHDCFVCVNAETDEVYGSFYVKPNFPGRSSHICNAGFIVSITCRNKGVAQFMATAYPRIARDLGYDASYFNLVFDTNPASLHIWDKLGHERVGRVPRAGRLKGLGYVDAVQYYLDLNAKKTDLTKSSLVENGGD